MDFDGIQGIMLLCAYVLEKKITNMREVLDIIESGDMEK